MANSDDNAAR